jgi:hypothetical protein
VIEQSKKIINTSLLSIIKILVGKYTKEKTKEKGFLGSV